MKNKKLFAILTLVCFMFTLMPVAAFAAAPAKAEDYAVKVTVGTADPAEEVFVAPTTTFSVLAYDADNVALTGNAAYYVENENGDVIQILDGTGPVQFTASKNPGTYTIYGVIDVANSGLSGLVTNANDLASEETAASAVAKIKNSALNDQIINTVAYVTVEAPTAYFGVKASALTDGANAANSDTINESVVDVVADNGFASVGKVTINVATYAQKSLANQTKMKNLSGQKLTIIAPDYVNVVPADAKKVTTNAQGNITYAISASKAGTFTVVFKYQNAEAEVKVTASPEGVATVETVEQPKAPVNNAPDTNGYVNTGVDFKFVDANGSAYKTLGVPTDANAKFSGIAKITVLSQPANSKLDGKNGQFELFDGTTTGDGVYDLKVNTANPLKVGSYEVKVSLANGNSATASFEVAEMGDVVGIRFVQAPASVEIGGVLAKASFAIQAYDAAGVTESVNFTDLSANGKAVKDENAGKTAFNIEKDDKYVGSVITVLARYTVNGDTFVATKEVAVVDKGMEVKYLNTEAEVGVNTTLVAKVLDASGNYTNVTIENVQFNVTGKGWADASTLGAWDPVKKQLAVNFIASAAGDYSLETVIELTDGSYLYSVETIKVGNNEAAFKDVVVVSLGADKMIVNDTVVAMDVAPFIENNRTMMQYNVLYVFGIDVDWVKETNSVVAEGNGLKVVMQLGSKVATVNGEEVTLDVAPYAVNGRTVVPVGFITGLLDITPVFTYNADGTIADILFAK